MDEVIGDWNIPSGNRRDSDREKTFRVMKDGVKQQQASMEDGNKVSLSKFTKATEDHTVKKPGSPGEQDLRCVDHRCQFIFKWTVIGPDKRMLSGENVK